MALIRIELAEPDAIVLRLLMSGWVTEWPMSPSSDTITISMGKIDSIP
jgi:hypothetical protein